MTLWLKGWAFRPWICAGTSSSACALPSRCRMVRDAGVVAFAGVEGAIGYDAYDLLIGRDLVQQFGQHGRVTHVTGGELGCADFH